MTRSILLSELLARQLITQQPTQAAAQLFSDPLITHVANQSKAVRPGTLFFAISGSKFDGQDFIPEAIERGAVAVVVNREGFRTLASDVPIILVQDARAVLSEVAASFYGDPSGKMLTVGVTGTNGKTTIVSILGQLLEQLGRRPACIGTLGLTYGKQLREDLGVTTPDALQIQRFLAEAVALGADACAMEATSIGVVQHRTSAVAWDLGIFTNLTRDHLDYHKSFEEYGKAKIRFFTDELCKGGLCRDELSSGRKKKPIAVLNADDPFALEIYRALHESPTDTPRIVTFSTGRPVVAEFGKTDARITHRKIIRNSDSQRMLLGLEIGNESAEVSTQLVGDYNVSNLLAAVAAIHSLGFSLDRIAEALPHVTPVPGRLESVGNGTLDVYVDYAHTPDGLLRAQQSLRDYLRAVRQQPGATHPTNGGKLITVFGCGGDRDRGKRSPMGQVVAENSDLAVVTSDNPRTENPDAIIQDILPGFHAVNKQAGIDYHTIADRRAAIGFAIAQANPGDVVLIAGKGHEAYQEVNGIRSPFSDQEESRRALAKLAGINR